MKNSKRYDYEIEFQKAFMKKLRSIPYSYWQKVADKKTSGIPDVIGCLFGLFFAFELKVGDEPSKIQLQTIEDIKKAKGVSLVVSPENANEVLRYLAKVAQHFLKHDNPNELLSKLEIRL